MSKKDFHPLLHPIETIRTAPVAISAAIGNIALSMGASGLTAEIASSIATRPTLWPLFVTLGVGATVAYDRVKAAARDSLEAADMVGFRGDIEFTLTEIGYHDRAMQDTLKHWCDRQATLVACERTGGRELASRYKALIKDNKDKIQLPRIPHI